MSEREDELKEALEGMCYQFAYRGKTDEGRLTIWTGGLSSLELAFSALGWPDPQPYPEGECQNEGCYEAATCGTPTTKGYKFLCGDCYSAFKDVADAIKEKTQSLEMDKLAKGTLDDPQATVSE